MLRADVRVGRREPRLILIDIRRLPGICQLLRRTTCFGVHRIPTCIRVVCRAERGCRADRTPRVQQRHRAVKLLHRNQELHGI